MTLPIGAEEETYTGVDYVTFNVQIIQSTQNIPQNRLEKRQRHDPLWIFTTDMNKRFPKYFCYQAVVRPRIILANNVEGIH